jgi:hypothetical protein
MAKSILWEDATELADRQVVTALVEKAVPGSDEHKKRCVDKIIKTIKAEEWQKSYPNRNFVFCVFYKLDINLIEISFGLSAQVVDALFFMMSGGIGGSFGDKAAYIYKKVYGFKMQRESAEALKVLRNNIMHYGAIFGINNAISADDKKLLKAYCTKFKPTTQIMTDNQILINLAGSFDYLIRELVLRVLGLEDNDFAFNLRPPARLSMFYAEEQKK